MIKTLFIFGTRPEAIKLAPVINKMKQSVRDFEVIVCVTAQHRQMLDQALELFNIAPDIDLNIMRTNQSLDALSASMMLAVSETLRSVKPDLVLVQGDTTSAMISALAAFYQKIPVGHVEAGLRTDTIYNPFPEEANRRIISTFATLNFAPTTTAVDALKREGLAGKSIFRTGNTIVDALNEIIRHSSSYRLKNIVHLPSNRYILVTAHRRESFGQPLRNICSALRDIVRQNQDVDIIYPVHLNPNIHNVVHAELAGEDRIHLISPVGYDELVELLKNCYFVLTDSGGIQEEAPTFGKPVLVMRLTTERPEGIKAGVAKLVGDSSNRILEESNRLLRNPSEYKKMSRIRNPYGDGKASERIAQIILTHFNSYPEPA